MTSESMKSPISPNESSHHAKDGDADRILMRNMGIPDDVPKPPRSDAAFVSALREELSQRRKKSAWRVQLSSWGPAFACAMALAWWVYPADKSPPASATISDVVASATSDEHTENLFRESMDVLDEEDIWLESLDDESLLAFHDSLER